MECLMCRDKGKLGGCPRCGKVLNLKGNDEQHLKASEMTRMCIPKNYLKNEWNSLILEKDYVQFCDDAKFKFYLQQLNKCYTMLKEGEIPNISALVTSPIGFGKTTWAYNCMIQAKQHNYSIVPLIDTSQMRRMLLTATERPEWSNSLAGYGYNEYLTSDFLIVQVAMGPEYVYAYETIVNLVNSRSRIGKPTIFISNYSVRELISQDKKKILLKLLNGGTNVDPLKYLINIEFIEYASTEGR